MVGCYGAESRVKLVHAGKKSLKCKSCGPLLTKSKGRVAAIRGISGEINGCLIFSLSSNNWSGWQGLNVERYQGLLGCFSGDLLIFIGEKRAVQRLSPQHSNSSQYLQLLSIYLSSCWHNLAFFLSQKTPNSDIRESLFFSFPFMYFVTLFTGIQVDFVSCLRIVIH